MDPPALKGLNRNVNSPAGILDWIYRAHREAYEAEQGWDSSFADVVSGILHAPELRGIWVRSIDGVRAGCVACSEHDPQTAELRLLLVEQWARRRGLGRALAEDCIGFARDAGYARIVLWTADCLEAACALYEVLGFKLESSYQDVKFGATFTSRIYSLDLSTSGPA